MEEIIKFLRVICRLLKDLEPKEVTVKPGRIWGESTLVKMVLFVEVWPLYPEHKSYDVRHAICAKTTRLSLGEVIQDKLTEILAGYKVEVRIEK